MYCRYPWGEYLASEERSNEAEGPQWYLCTGPATAAATRGDDEVRKGREPDYAATGHAGTSEIGPS